MTSPFASTIAKPAGPSEPGGSNRCRMISLFELLPTGFVPTGPYATIVVAHAPGGTIHAKVMVVPDFVPRTVVLPKLELLMTTSACVSPSRSGSVAPTIVPVIESPA
jgi:hypothetical protein